MYAPLRTLAIGLLFGLTASACDDGTGPTGSLGDFDPSEAASVANGLFTPIYDGAGPTFAVRDAWETLTAQGVSFDVAGDLTFPAGIQGRTFAYDLADDSWGIDSTRTDAPAGGARILWYRSDAAGNLVQPLVEEGYVDLTDEDTGGSLSRVGIRMVATTDTGDVVLADLTESLATTDGAQYAEVLRTTGFYGGATRQIDFDMVSDATGDSVSGAEDLTLSISLSAGGQSYVLTVTGGADSDTSAVQQNYRATISYDDVTTELDLDFTESQAGAQTGSGTLAYQGATVVQITVNGSDFLYADADGTSLSTGDQVAVDTLVRTLFLTGLQAFLSMPLLFY